MITKELLQQAIKETAEGMLSGDPDYACKCVQARDGSRVRVIGWMSERCRQPMLALCEYPDGHWIPEWYRDDGAYLQSGEVSRYDLIPVPRKPRKLKCCVRWYKTSLNNVFPSFIEPDSRNGLPSGAKWITDSIEVVAEEKRSRNDSEYQAIDAHGNAVDTYTPPPDYAPGKTF